MITQSDTPLSRFQRAWLRGGSHGTSHPASRWFNLGTTVALALDYLSITLGICFGVVAYQALGHPLGHSTLSKLFLFSIQYTLAFLLFARIHSLYSQATSLLYIHETASVLRISVFTLFLLSFSLLFTPPVLPTLLLLLSWLFTSILVIVQKHCTRSYVATLRKPQTAERQALILGTGAEARRIFSYLSQSPDLHIRPIGFVEEGAQNERVIYSHDYTFRKAATVYSGPLDSDFLDRMHVSDLFVADSGLSSSYLADLASLASTRDIRLSLVGSFHPDLRKESASARTIDGLLVTSLTLDESNRAPLYEGVKRACDLVVAVGVILLTLPAMLCMALWVRLTSEGPIFFRQVRVGRNGKTFHLYKFRSMYTSAPKYARSPESGDDPRITSAGRFLRKTSLDELPQLFNVLKGDMALVGPRPEMPYIVNAYTAHQARRLSVTPGITGLWQLSADRRYAIHESIEYDLYYIENRGFFLDAAILIHTAAFAMKGI